MTDEEFLADVTQQNCYDITREEFERLVGLARIGAAVKRQFSDLSLDHRRWLNEKSYSVNGYGDKMYEFVRAVILAPPLSPSPPFPVPVEVE